MAVGTFTLYSPAVKSISQAAINLSSDTIIMALVTSAYTPSDAHSAWSSASATEVATGNGYTAGGIALTSQTNNLAGAVVTFTSSAVTWASPFSATCKYALLVKRAAGALAGTDLLIGYVDLSSGGGSITGQGGSFVVSPNGTNGWFQMTHTP